MITRRSLFGILAGAIAAPIIVRPGLIMPVKALKPNLIRIKLVKRYTVVAEKWQLGEMIHIRNFNAAPAFISFEQVEVRA